jgi:hypothetical protein
MGEGFSKAIVLIGLEIPLVIFYHSLSHFLLSNVLLKEAKGVGSYTIVSDSDE